MEMVFHTSDITKNKIDKYAEDLFTAYGIAKGGKYK